MMKNQPYNPWTIDIFGNMDNNNPKFPHDPFFPKCEVKRAEEEEKWGGGAKKAFLPPQNPPQITIHQSN